MDQPTSCPARTASRVPRAIAVGAFDGVHLGHQAVVHSVLEAARQRGLTSAALTFEPTPRQYFGRDPNSEKRLTPDPERLALLCNLGVEQVLVQTFDRDLRAMTPEEFAQAILVDELDARFVAIGASHTFGSGAGAGPENMRELGEHLGFEVEIVPLVSVGGLSVSSTAIREALVEGDMQAARTMLGRPYAVSGTVIRGRGLGADLQAPTANLEARADKFLPAHGVYAAAALIGEGESGPLPAAISLGPSPTFDIDETRFEVHLLDFEGDLYGAELTVALLERLRPIQDFASRDELVAQIRRDVERVREVFAANST
ncbi:MAG: bifunctional riboflavin kinase/FAD synthetase [Armatimonadetes bacterium]|nr:bifunctional riboflavin kinase/FAD synthetase [Armatimonadota bacterium]